ncbi:ribonuclease HII [Candidatus Azambacteria bacterium]|nr:ribonuclease HII [Candidatus Azambacteria bacterium]
MQRKTIPTLAEEEKIWRHGGVLVGVDEVGRGPLAGPVCATAVAFDLGDAQTALFIGELGINDSKKLSVKKREQIFEALTTHPNVYWATGQADEKAIDRINILQASLRAMRHAVGGLQEKCGALKRRELLYIDGREIIPEIASDQKAIIGGDAKICSIAAASIIAKVLRDRMMREYAKQYPQYRFEKHKGYGTKLHFELIKKHGMSPIHRRSFLKGFKSPTS